MKDKQIQIAKFYEALRELSGNKNQDFSEHNVEGAFIELAMLWKEISDGTNS